MTDRKTEERDNREYLGFDRRTYLKGLATSAAIPIAAGASATASGNDYEEIVVSRNDRFTKRLSDGETWGNVLIDISAPGAKFRIRATGNDWTIRNVGIRGVWDDPSKEEPVIVRGNGRIENFYWADGTNWTAGGGAATGIFVPARHSGRVVMERMNLQDFGDNGVYASSPGNGSEHPATGGGGEIIIRDSYASHCTPAGFRLGTDGSKLENCVMHRNYRNFWAFYEHTEVIDSDMSDADGTGDISNRSGLNDIQLGDSAWTKSNFAEVTATNSYWGTTGAHGGASTSNINGSPANRSPRTQPEEVEGVPLSAEEAAAGSSSGSGSSPSADPVTIEEVWNEDETNEIVLRSSGSAEYRFDGNGVAELGEDADTDDDDPYRDTVSEDGDAFTVEGYLGGFRDDFTVEGEIVAVDVEGSVTATVNGEEFEPEDLEGVGSWDIDEGIASVWRTDEPNHVEINGGSPDDIAEYRIDGNGLAEAGEYADTNSDDPYADTVTSDGDAFTIEGYVAGFRDDFEVEGAVTDVESNQDLTATVNGHEFDLAELEGIGSWDEDDDDTDAAEELPHEFVIDGSDANGSTSYRFSVSGDLVSTGGTGSAADDASVDGQSAEGTVEDGQDSYRFSGNITDFWMAGEASIDLNFGD